MLPHCWSKLQHSKDLHCRRPWQFKSEYLFLLYYSIEYQVSTAYQTMFRMSNSKIVRDRKRNVQKHLPKKAERGMIIDRSIGFPFCTGNQCVDEEARWLGWCALTSYDAIQVRFLIRQSIAVSFTSTALPERVMWEAEGNGAYLRVRWTFEKWYVRLQWHG